MGFVPNGSIPLHTQDNYVGIHPSWANQVSFPGNLDERENEKGDSDLCQIELLSVSWIFHLFIFFPKEEYWEQKETWDSKMLSKIDGLENLEVL